MATSNVEIELAFTDETTMKFVIGPFTPSALANVKTKIKEFNAAGYRDWEEMIINENGALIKTGTDYPQNTPIKSATIVTTIETEVV